MARCWGWLAVGVVLMTPGARGDDGTSPERPTQPITRGWEFRKDGEPESAWRPVSVPSTFEEVAGPGFDGVGWYRVRFVPPTRKPGDRLLVRFGAAATAATVWCNGVEVGTHLGGWTPFRCDVSTQVPTEPSSPSVELKVRLDEAVGHNTQGFLPIVEPHFGGLWQQVRAEVVHAPYVDDLALLAVGDPAIRQIRFAGPVVGASEGRVAVSYRRQGAAEWSAEQDADITNGRFQAAIAVADPELWSPAHRMLYEVRVRIPASGDAWITRAAFRSIRTEGTRLMLNDQPLSVRGVLNWGYYPPRLAPVPDPERFRRDLALIRSWGFNLVKFCLWIPPQEYLDLCDEEGLLAWVEYPTWHPKLDPAHRADLEREFTEFFAFDRNHPSVVLRSLTCETGASADLGVIRALYDRAKAMIPGAVVEDDSSWIGWNRIHDFYDDHPYGNNHTWVATLDHLKAHIAEHGPKPLVLGEAIAADTWAGPEPLQKRAGDQHPYWLPGSLESSIAWKRDMARRYGPGGLDRLTADSKKAALLMRKFQIEVYRREVPAGGYVVSVLRDFPLAAMGLLDYGDQPKWPADQWAWHGADQLVLDTPADRRAFAAGETTELALGFSHFGPDKLEAGTATMTLGDVAVESRVASSGGAAEPGALHRGILRQSVCWKESGEQPSRRELRAELKGLETPIRNAWPVWVVPPARLPEVRLHGSVDRDTAAWFSQAQPLAGPADDALIIARRFDRDLIDRLEAGARVLMLPDGEKGSFATSNHWFLRGGPYLPGHPLLEQVPRDLLVELQAFDLAGPVLPHLDSYLDQLDPLALLWDNHDLKEVRTHGLAFETRVGKGRLFVSSLAHGPTSNAAGQWLLGVFLDHLWKGPEPRKALTDDTIARLREKVGEHTIDLSEKPWRFRPDPENRGLAAGWEKPATLDGEGWTDLRIDRHWESQGFERLDGWAFYRTRATVPADWKGQDVYVSFQGADDYYELYVNGQKVGTGGDIATKQTAFEERKSHRVTDLVKPGEPCTIAVRIFDWYGAGGLFRPVLLGTARIGAAADWIR